MNDTFSRIVYNCATLHFIFCNIQTSVIFWYEIGSWDFFFGSRGKPDNSSQGSINFFTKIISSKKLD
jgi:hypothetical protein